MQSLHSVLAATDCSKEDPTGPRAPQGHDAALSATLCHITSSRLPWLPALLGDLPTVQVVQIWHPYTHLAPPNNQPPQSRFPCFSLLVSVFHCCIRCWRCSGALHLHLQEDWRQVVHCWAPLISNAWEV